ncbi:MAG TPA: SDR family NAD(P)-dependent oxidoreductase, partial [Blastocatellia bacterium]|nr:SDR family NAD(P)-dependent oxidoreductase [Blastocatellia bacterium]
MTEQPQTFEPRAALITGASRGIGRGIAVALARVGLDLVINYASHLEAAQEAQALAQAAANRDGLRVEIYRADIASAEDRRRLLAFTREQFGRLDLLVNNAGIAPAARVDLLDAGEESFDRLIAVNLKGPYFLTQQAARWMIGQIAEHGRSTYTPAIINISSISAYTASVERGEYCVAKAGLAMMTSLFAARLAGEGINVYEIRPGIIETDMTAAV